MISKSTLFAITIIFNLIVFILSTKLIISGTLKCNKSLLQGAKVSLCDGQSETNPKKTETSGSDGRFIFNTELSSSDSTYRVSIYYNCSLGDNKQSNESVYTRQQDYKSFANQANSGTRYQSRIDNIPDLINATSDPRYQHCNKN
uniref:Uncharacterized protein n=1 Tax=Parastrongyloides trichosuri TaxID=131310 RepID=A0A0N4ZXU5_PARTI